MQTIDQAQLIKALNEAGIPLPVMTMGGIEYFDVARGQELVRENNVAVEVSAAAPPEPVTLPAVPVVQRLTVKEITRKHKYAHTVLVGALAVATVLADVEKQLREDAASGKYYADTAKILLDSLKADSQAFYAELKPYQDSWGQDFAATMVEVSTSLTAKGLRFAADQVDDAGRWASNAIRSIGR